MDLLPHELAARIVDYLDRPALRHVRFQNKRYASLAQPILLQQLHLSPNSRSFERAAKIANCPELSRHVRDLVYHVNKHGSDTEVQQRYETFCYDTSDSQVQGWAVLETLMQLHQDFLDELRTERVFRCSQTEIPLLTTLMPKLRSLQSVWILDDWSASEATHAYFSHFKVTEKLRMQQNMTNGNLSKHVVSVLRAAHDSGTSLRAVHTSGVGCEFFDHIKFYMHDQIREQAKTFKELELVVTGHKYTSNNVHIGLKHLLESAANLETISLDLDEWDVDPDFSVTGNPNKALAIPLLGGTWAQLRDVGLASISADEDSLINFFTAHSATLRTVRLSNLEIGRHGRHERRRNKQGSVISFLIRLRECTTLECIHLRGSFSNRFDEAWYVDEGQASDNCLRARIERHIAHQAPTGSGSNTGTTHISENAVVQPSLEDIGGDPFFPRNKRELREFADASWVSWPDLLLGFDVDSSDSEDWF